MDDHYNLPELGATPVSVELDNGWGLGSIESGGDRDAFEFVLEQPTTVTISAVGTDAALDTFLRLYNSSGVLIEDNDDIFFDAFSGSNLNSQIVRTLSPGVYYATVGGYNDTSTGDFALAIDFAANPSGDQHANVTGSAATPLNLDLRGDVAFRDRLETVGDRDVFELRIQSSTTAQISATRLDGSNLDAFLRIYSDAGTLIASNDDVVAGVFDSFLDLSLEAGTYFVSVGSYQDRDVGDYQLAVETKLSFLPGDFDQDSDVDGEDFLNWQTGFGMVAGATASDGDGDFDGDVDGEDFLIWQQNLGKTANTYLRSRGAESTTGSAAAAPSRVVAAAKTLADSSRSESAKISARIGGERAYRQLREDAVRFAVAHDAALENLSANRFDHRHRIHR